MRVLQLGKFYPILGGVEKVMWNLTRGLSAQGTDCDMLCACLKKDMPEGGVIRFNGHGRVICLPAITKLAATMICPAMVKWLRRHCGEYDIIHVHHPDPMAALALRLSGYKGRVILHWHSDILKQKFLLTFYRPLQSWLIRRAETVVGTTPVYVAQSPYLQKVQDKVTYVPIGVEPLNYDKDASEALRAGFPGKKIVFSLGRLVGYKGYRYLVEAASLLPDDYVVVIGGSGPLHKELSEQIEALGLKGKVILSGYLPAAEAAAWFGACDVYVISSIWKTEAFGIVQIEAMSCGKPVVATEIPESGVSWVNEHGVSGLNTKVEDSDSLARAILEITSKCDNFASYSANALKRYRSLFTLDSMVDKTLDIYNKTNNQTNQ